MNRIVWAIALLLLTAASVQATVINTITPATVSAFQSGATVIDFSSVAGVAHSGQEIAMTPPIARRGLDRTKPRAPACTPPPSRRFERRTQDTIESPGRVPVLGG